MLSPGSLTFPKDHTGKARCSFETGRSAPSNASQSADENSARAPGTINARSSTSRVRGKRMKTKQQPDEKECSSLRHHSSRGLVIHHRDRRIGCRSGSLIQFTQVRKETLHFKKDWKVNKLRSFHSGYQRKCSVSIGVLEATPGEWVLPPVRQQSFAIDLSPDLSPLTKRSWPSELGISRGSSIGRRRCISQTSRSRIIFWSGPPNRTLADVYLRSRRAIA